jgi:replication-associated recombination protein RarA
MEEAVIDTLSSAKQKLIGLFRCRERNPVAPFRADRWVTNSLLQKAIRRSEAIVAERAALTFLQQGGSAIWRRFLIIAFEDVGIACPDTVAMVVAASADSTWRKNVGGEERVAIHLARMLSEAPKSRSAEHLITTANCHPAFVAGVHWKKVPSNDAALGLCKWSQPSSGRVVAMKTCAPEGIVHLPD